MIARSQTRPVISNMAVYEKQDDADQVFAIETWRYLRVSMIVFVVGIFAAVGFEMSKTHPHCFATSISAYYYTPVHGFFIGALIAVGTCLICLKGNTPGEDILLNLAGMFAPVVALVPTPNPGSCGSVLTTTENRDTNISNNMFVLLFLGAIALIFLAAFILVLRRRSGGPLSRGAVIGYGVTVVVWGYAFVTFGWWRSFFTHTAHYTAAILMFFCFLLVVIADAISFRKHTEHGSPPKTPARQRVESAVARTKLPPNRYGYIAALMIIDIIVFVILWIASWKYWVIGIEASLITLFAVFWGLQTAELWGKGLRGAGESNRGMPPGANMVEPAGVGTDSDADAA